MFLKKINIEKRDAKPINKLALGAIFSLVFLFVGCDFCNGPSDNGVNPENRIFFTAFSVNDNSPVIFSSSPTGREISVLARNILLNSAPSNTGKIAYTKFDGSSASNWLYISNIDGKEEKLITKENALFLIQNPIISPDGTKIIFNGGFNRLLVYDIEKTVFNQISSKLLQNSSITFSPDGKKIAYFESDVNEFSVKVISSENTDMINVLFSKSFQGNLQSAIMNYYINWDAKSEVISFSFTNSNREYVKSINITDKVEKTFDYSADAISIFNPTLNQQNQIIVFTGKDGNLWARNYSESDNRLFQLTNAEVGEKYYLPYWSKDGKYLMVSNINDNDSNYNYNDLIVFEIVKEDDIIKSKGSYLISNNTFKGFWM